ncbi:MAG: hypothetical protein IPK74_13170 [Deltaproteobacteria bacterium]|nr:hypothetical protein [Deltaproteobacteria bacterium]
MNGVEEMPLQEVLQALSRTPMGEPQLRAALATTCARWHIVRGETNDAIRHLGHALDMVPDLRPAMRLLHRIYLDRGDVRSAVMYLDQEIRATRHPREAAALYRERGVLVEAYFHDLSAAQQCYQAALKATPRDLAVLRAVERVSLARGDVFWLIANLESQLEVLQDPGLSAGLLHDLAMLEARHRGDLGLAGDLLLGALELVPGHAVLAGDLFRIAEVAGDTELMLHALELEADARPVGGRAMPLARASLGLRDARERQAALQLLQAAAHEQPHCFSLWRSLEELAMGMSRYEVAFDALAGQVRALTPADDAPLRAELFYRIGRLALFRLDRAPEGLAAMRRALKLNPAHVPALEDTGRFLGAGGMWAQLLELVRVEIGGAKNTGISSEELALLHLRAGQLLEERLGELEGARRHYESAMATAPNYRPARDRLERLLHHMGDRAALQGFYAAELAAARTPARRAFLLSVLAQLHATDDAVEPAIGYLGRLLRERPDSLGALQLQARLLARGQRHAELLEVTEREITLTRSPPRAAKLLHRCGELALTLGDRGRARAEFTRALEAVDDHKPAMEALGRLLREDGDWEALVALLRKESLYANDRGRQAALQLEIAAVLAGRLDRADEALAELEALLARWPRHLPALHAAEGLAARLGRADVLLSLLEQHIAAVSGPRTRALLLHRAASLRSAGGDDDGAVRDLVRALELWPQLGVARARLLRLYEKLGNSRELQAFAEAGLTAERGADDRRAMALQLAELTPKPVVAIQYLGAVAEARPDDYVTQLRLARACGQAGRPSRQAGALTAALSRFEGGVEPGDAGLLALRYRAARAQEGAGNLDAADAGYAAIHDVAPAHTLARRGRLRLKERRREASVARSTSELQAAATAAAAPAQRAALLTIAAEQHEHRIDLRAALAAIDMAIEACEGYQPAWHARARILERMGDAPSRDEAIATLERLATMQKDRSHRARTLCRAGALALRTAEDDVVGSRAWTLFAEALTVDPGCDRAFVGLRRARLRTSGPPLEDPALGQALQARMMASIADGSLRAASLRELARTALAIAGPELAASMLQTGLPHVEDDAGLHVDLAHAHARRDRWADAVGELDLALAREHSPERRAALHYFAADARERAGAAAAAVEHFLAAAEGGYYPKHAYRNAERIAAVHGDVQRRVSALQGLVNIADGSERAHSLHALAEVHRAQLGQPEVAVDLMRELLLLRPTDVDVALELRRLLLRLGRHEEAAAAALAAVAHQRAWLRAAATTREHRPETTAQPVLGLLRLFDAAIENDGVYLCAAALEVLAPQLIPAGRSCDELATEPWPLPKPQEGRPFDAFVGDLPHASAFDLLREGVFYLGELPETPQPTVDLTPSRSMPANAPVVIAVRAIANAMGVPQPLVFVDAAQEHEIEARLGGAPALVVGRRLAAAPFGAAARDRIGRALLRLSTGGDGLHRHTEPTRILALCVALCQACGVTLDVTHPYDRAFAQQVAEQLPTRDAMTHLQETALAFRDASEGLDPLVLRATLAMAEDRAGVLASADPRPALEHLRRTGELVQTRGAMLVGYLLSDDHIGLRRTLGYVLELNVPRRRAQEVSR